MNSQISVCKVCNRVRIGDEEWSENPSTKVNTKTPGVLVVDECGKCDKCPTQKENEPKSEPAGKKKKEVEKVSKTEEFAVMATENHKKIVACKKMMGKALLTLGTALQESYSNRYWKINHDSWEEYLATDEVGLRRDRASQLMKLSRSHRQLEADLKREVSIEEIAEGRHRLILPCIIENEDGTIKDAEGIADLLEKAKTLGGQDFEAEVDEYRKSSGISKQQGGRKPQECMISSGGPVNDAKGNRIGKVHKAYANEKVHIITVYLGNEHITDDGIHFVIP